VRFDALGLLNIFRMRNVSGNEVANGKVERKLKPPRKTGKHLHEICPHIVKIVSEPYYNPYVVIEGAQSELPNPRLITYQQGDIPVIFSVPHGASTKDDSVSWQSKHLAAREGVIPAFQLDE